MSTKHQYKHQHYVPRFYLAAFTDPKTPQGQEPYVWVYKRAEDKPYARAPRRVAIQKHYYSFENETGELDTSVEVFFSDIESQAKPLIRRLIEAGNPGGLTQDERGVLAYFIALLSVRIPAFRDTIEKFASDMMRKVSLLSAHNSENFERTMREAYAAKGQEPPEDIETVRQFVLSGKYEITTSPVFSLQMMIQLAPHASEYIYDYNWRILRSRSCRFITSDRPLVLISTKRLTAPYSWSTGWETPWMEATLPLSPDTCLLISLHHPPGTEDTNAAIVKEINLRTATYADKAVYTSQQIDSAILNRPANWNWWKPVTEALVIPETDGADGSTT